MIRVRFLKVWRMYQPGEFAGFDAAMANLIVAGGFAVTVENVVEAVAETKAEAKARAKADADAKAKADAAEEAARKAEADRLATEEEVARKAAEGGGA